MINNKIQNKVNSLFSVYTTLIALALLIMVGCKKKEEKSSTTISEEINTTTAGLNKGCYTYDKNDNFVNFEILNTDNPVKGKLTYAFREKDRNTGNFIGEVKDNKLIGTYTFQSEGITSEREVAFLIKENQLIEGYGDLDSTGTKFLNINKINYTSSMPLTMKDCE